MAGLFSTLVAEFHHGDSKNTEKNLLNLRELSVSVVSCRRFSVMSMKMEGKK